MARARSRDLFPTDQPVPASGMIGREADLVELSGRLANGIHQIVAGPRRTGKTTLCEAALEQLRKDGAYIVSVDLFQVSDAAALAETLAAEIVANRSAVRRTIGRVRGALSALREGAALQTVIRMSGELGEELEISYRPGIAARDPERYLNYALSLLNEVAAADEVQMVLFIDEFQEIARDGSPFGDPDELTKRMRSILQRSDRVTCLFAGSLQHLMRDLFIPKHRALHAFGGFFDLGEISHEAWVRGLAERFAIDACQASEDALARMIDFGEGRPRATMLVAQHSHYAAVTAETHEIDPGLVAVGLASAMDGERASHELTVHRIRDWRKMGRDALQVVQAIARGEPAYVGLESKRAGRAVDALRDAAIIEQPREREWIVGDPLLRRYLRQR